MRSIDVGFNAGAFLPLQASFSIGGDGAAASAATANGSSGTQSSSNEFSLHDIPHMQINITPTHVGITSTSGIGGGVGGTANVGEVNGASGAAISAIGAAISSLPAAILVAHHSPPNGATAPQGPYAAPPLPPVSISAGPVSVYGSIAHSQFARTFLDQRLRFPRLYFWDRNIDVSL